MHSNGSRWLFAVPASASLGAWAEPLARPGLVAQDTIHTADTAWPMTATALVLLTTLPGIALFYGGMVRKKSLINTLANVVAVAALISLLWFAAGDSLAFTPGNAWIGGTDRLWISGLDYLKEAGKLSVSHIAAASGAMTWMISQRIVRGRPSLLGLCSGLVAGLVLLWITRGLVGLRVDEPSEITGLGVSEHREHLGT